MKNPLKLCGLFISLLASQALAYPAYVASPMVIGGMAEGETASQGYRGTLSYTPYYITYSSSQLAANKLVPINVTFPSAGTFNYQFTDSAGGDYWGWAGNVFIFWVRKADATDLALIKANPSILTGDPSTSTVWAAGSVNPNPWQLLTDTSGKPCVAVVTNYNGGRVGGSSIKNGMAVLNLPFGHYASLMNVLDQKYEDLYPSSDPDTQSMLTSILNNFQTAFGNCTIVNNRSDDWATVNQQWVPIIPQGTLTYDTKFTGYELVAEECSVDFGDNGAPEKQPSQTAPYPLSCSATWQKLGYLGGNPPVSTKTLKIQAVAKPKAGYEMWFQQSSPTTKSVNLPQ